MGLFRSLCKDRPAYRPLRVCEAAKRLGCSDAIRNVIRAGLFREQVSDEAGLVNYDQKRQRGEFRLANTDWQCELDEKFEEVAPRNAG